MNEEFKRGDLARLAREAGVPYATFIQRIRKLGWSVERASTDNSYGTGGRGGIHGEGYKIFGYGRNGAMICEHTIVAERALGKPLPAGAEVHHVDENRLNNSPTNLVICDRAYHLLIHRRMEALKQCGNANWKRCPYCNTWDDPANLTRRRNRNECWHRACYNKRKIALYHAKKSNVSDRATA